jgi:hypothetical protein
MKTLVLTALAVTSLLWTGCRTVAVVDGPSRGYSRGYSSVSFSSGRPYYYYGGHRHWGYPPGYRHSYRDSSYRYGYRDSGRVYPRRSGYRSVYY